MIRRPSCTCRRFVLLIEGILVLALRMSDVPAATYHVAQSAGNAADTNAGTESAPWKTIGRATAAKELKPGDTVLIHSAVYREQVELKVSGAGQADHVCRRARKPRRCQGIGVGA